ncbi:MAG: penicillin-binding protein [Flavobacteriales bacterium]|nr:penicillin-binding protein [Flavobacteriales bacterium]
MGKPQEKNKAKRLFWVLGLAPFIILGLLLIAAAFSDLPEFKELENPKSDLASEIITSDGNVIGKFWNKNRTNIEFEDIPDHMVQALIATEDERYHSHSGIDPKGAARAIVFMGSRGGGSTITQQLAKLLFHERPKTKFRRIFQKAQEWIIAGRLEKSYTKNEIITMYFNQYDFLYNAVGLKSAANIYFGKDPIDLVVEEAAVLVGMLKNPIMYNPKKEKFEESAMNRRNTVLYQMVRNEFLSQAEFDSLKLQQIELKFTPQSHEEGLAPYFRETMRSDVKKILESKDEEGNFKHVDANGEPYDIYNDGLRIYTPIDSRLQEHAEFAVKEHLSKELQKDFDRLNRKNKDRPFSDDVDKTQINKILENAMRRTDRYKVLTGKRCGFCERIKYVDKIKSEGKEVYSCSYPDHKYKYKVPIRSDKEIKEIFKIPVQTKVFTWEGYKDTLMSPMDSIRHHKKFLHAGLISIDPRNGFVRAWVGGIDYKYFKYDHVRQGKRQVGSTFKPIIYTNAIRDGYSPCYELPNQKVCFDLADGSQWCPKNSGDNYGGVISLKAGLANSVNTVTAWVMKNCGGPKATIKLARDLGIKSHLDEVPSLCLGVADLSVMEVTAANATFANKGVYIEPITILRIDDKNGNTIYEAEPNTNEAIDEDNAYTMLDMMMGTSEGVFNKSTGRISGTAMRLRGDDKRRKYDNIGKMQIACKTGTTQNNSDGWFIGLTPELATGVWVGADDRSVHFESTGYGQGANTALPIWGYYMNKAYKDKRLNISQKDFEKPPYFYSEDCDETQENGFNFEGADEGIDSLFEDDNDI